MKIRLDNVVKTFDTFRAVHGVSLDIESGELVALLGPSGSGKTTILRMVAGLEYADGGHIYFGDEDATDIPVRDRGVGFVFQHYALFPHMTVAENIAFGMKVSKVKRDEGRDRRACRRAPAAGEARRSRRALSRRRFPAASASASRSPARSPSIRRCCCSTSRSARSTPMCGATCAAGCARSMTSSASPRCSSRTTRKRRSTSPTASSS